MKTRCRQCRKLIEFKTSYCEECAKKLNKNNKNRLKDKYANATTKTSRWQSLRMKIIQRDKCCVLCFQRGFIENRTLQVHHIVKRTEDISLIYTPSNLITLCRSCHEEVEKMSVLEQKKLFSKNINTGIDYELL